MKKIFTLLSISVLPFLGMSQTYWAEDAAEVFYENCTACHNPEGIAPNSLMSYNDCVTYGPLIQSYVGADIMPPWTADTGYVHYAGERVLTQNEKDIILNWISDGMLEGDPGQAPPQPVYNGEQILQGTPDLVVTAPNYMSKATSTSDDYVCFAVPSGLLQDRIVKAIEVIPGNRQTVHHCLVYTDNTGSATTDTSGFCAGPTTSTLMGGYTPGSTPIIFPSTGAWQAGMEMPAGSDVVFAMHYPAGSYGEWDQTKINFYFYPEPVSNFREIECNSLIEDWFFSIPANTFDSTSVSTGGIGSDRTLLSVFPHMHLLGYYIDSYAIAPGNDTIPLTRVPQWDFDWQDFYWFKNMIHLPAGTTLHGKGIWNNTVTNPHNPNNPPITVNAGLNTSDEMFLIYYHYMDYLVGDELLDVDSLTNLFLTLDDDIISEYNIQAFPNPFTDYTNIAYFLQNAAYVNLYIYDVQGRVVKKLFKGKQNSGTQTITWDGTNAKGNEASPGLYFYSIRIDGQQYSGKILKR